MTDDAAKPAAKKAAPAKTPAKTTAKKAAAPKTPAKKATAKKTTKSSAPEPLPAPAEVEEANEVVEVKERFHSDDPKEMFRYALEQKKNKSGYGSEAHLSTSSKGKGQSGKAGGKREFRRKSG